MRTLLGLFIRLSQDTWRFVHGRLGSGRIEWPPCSFVQVDPGKRLTDREKNASYENQLRLISGLDLGIK